MINFFEKIKIFHNLYIKNRSFIKRKSYSMDGEDQIIEKLFKDLKTGIYVDVGCYHPTEISNTALLYNKGWNGINIDISEYTIKLFNFLKPDDVNLNLAISNVNDFVEFFCQKKLSKLSTLSKSRSKLVFQGKTITKKIICKTLTKAIDDSIYKNQQIDFLNIDAEGHDFEVLESLDFNRYSPKVICIELMPDDWDFKNFQVNQTKAYKLLINKSYKLHWSGIVSHIFLKTEANIPI
jgi:hypothetical protein